MHQGRPIAPIPRLACVAWISLVLCTAPLAVGAQTPSLRDLAGAGGDEAAEQGGASSTEQAQDTSSAPAPPGETPRSTVRAFLDAVGDRDYETAARFLDASRSERPGSDLARHFEVVLDKTLWIDVPTVSDEPSGELEDGLPARQEQLGEIALGDANVPVLLERQRTPEGSRWRFSALTVSRIPALYEAHGYGPLGTYLPDFFFELRLFEVQLWQWLGLIALVLVAGLLSWAIASLLATLLRAALGNRQGQTTAFVASVVTGPARLAIGIAIFSAAKHLLGLAIAVGAVIGAIEGVLLVVAFTWAALRLVNVFSSVVEQRLRERGQESALTLLPPGRKTIKAFALALAALACFDSLGFNVTAVLAGLGVGGIAVALAAQKTVENLFGGVTLYSDRPVRVGDFCRFGDKVGNVEEIGLRSTRIRTLDRTVVTVPNADFANLHLENYTRRDMLWYHPRISLRYETTPDQLRYILVEVRKMLYAHPKVNPDPARIRFVEFGAYSLDLDVFAYVEVTDYGEFLEVAEDLNLRIMDIVAEAGSSFAFPSQTTYLEQGEPLDAKQGEEIGEAVERWREARELYLPRIPDEKVRELRGTLDYPPQGSPFAGNGRDR